MIELALPVVAVLGVALVCEALGLSRATWYRRLVRRAASAAHVVLAPRPRSSGNHARKLAATEEERVLAALHATRFQDKAPREVYATLLDEGVYLCSVRTMYRVLHAHQEVHERRAVLVHPSYARPELLARRPNELWSWDITKLRGPTTWTYYYLYVILDVFSRYVVGWMVALRESSDLARELIAQTCERQGIEPGQLTLHADRGSSMTSLTVAELLSNLGVAKTHSRPHVSDDNPFSESHFKTLKYRPEFPDRFGSEQHARGLCGVFFPWYNHEHHHTGLALLTPADVHFGRVSERLAARDCVLAAAHVAHPERFVRGVPRAPRPPAVVGINAPKESSAGTQDGPPSCAPKELGGRGGQTPAPGRSGAP